MKTNDTNKMQINFQKIIFLSTLLFLVSFGFVYAQSSNYTLLAPLPCVDPAKNCDTIATQTTLSDYLPGAFNLAIGIGAVLAFIMITYGGFLYATSDAITGKSEGREKIENAIWGLILVIGAWAILYTINPKILDFSLLLPPPTTVSSTPSISALPAICSNCQSIGSLPTNGSTGDYVEAGLLTKLNTFNGLMNTANVGWVITEAYPPTTTHHNPCHYDGTCIDARPSNQTPTNINTFNNTAVRAGLRPQYEVATQIEKDRLIASGVTISIIVVPGINNSHFSVYKN